MISRATRLAATIGVARACEVLGVPRSSFYRARQPKTEPAPRPSPARALTPAERDEVRQLLNSERFVDQAPRQVYATLLDEEIYLCHWRTMYRILESHQEVKERRNQRQHPLRPNLSWKRPVPGNCGVGISPNSRGRPNGSITTCTSSLMSTVALWSAGSWPKPRVPHWRKH